MISLTTLEDTVFWINPKYIVAIEDQDVGTLLSMLNGVSFRCKETSVQIMEKICS